MRVAGLLLVLYASVPYGVWAEVSRTDLSGLSRKYVQGTRSVLFLASTHSRTDSRALAIGTWDNYIRNVDDIILEQEVNRYALSRANLLLDRQDRNLSESEITQIVVAVRSSGVDIQPDLLSNVRPLVASFRLLNLLWRGESIPAQRAIEESMVLEAVRRGKTVFALETVKQYADATHQLSELEERALLDQSVAFLTDSAMRAKVIAWGRGSGEILSQYSCQAFERKYREIFLTSPLLEAAYQKHIFGRDTQLGKRLIDILDSRRSSKTVVVLGAAHLCGKDGVFEALRNAGFVGYVSDE